MIHPVKTEGIVVLLIGAPVLPGGKEHIVKKVQTKQAAISEHVTYFNTLTVL